MDWLSSLDSTGPWPAVNVSPKAAAGSASMAGDRDRCSSAWQISKLASSSQIFKHPCVGRFLDQGCDEPSEVAEAAFQSTARRLSACLAHDEREQLRQCSTITDVFAVLNGACHQLCGSEKGKKVETVAKSIHHYSKCIDIICQSHPEYAALVWGSLRLLLQISLNYYDLFSSLSKMLRKIGDNLERFEMYLFVYPTARIKSICYRLYAGILSFLRDAIVFCKKSRWRKYLTAFSSPYEVQFQETIDEIERLEKTLENDAMAVGMLQIQQGFSAMAEWVLGSRCQSEAACEVQRSAVTALLSDFERHLFRGREVDATYQEDVMSVYGLTSTSEWDQWFALERKYVSWSPQPQSHLIYMQTDVVEPQLYCRWIALGRALAGSVPFAQLIWNPTMTSYSALASMVMQIFHQRPDLLYEETRISRQVKSKHTPSLEELWRLFHDMLSVLPGLLGYITIASIGPQEEAFVAKILELLNSWRGCPINIQLVTPLHSTFPRPAEFLDIDAFYDVSPDLDSADAMHQVVLAEVGVPKRVSEDLKTSLWQSAWRTTCHAVNALALKQMQVALTRAVEKIVQSDPNNSSGPDILEWAEDRAGEQFLRSSLQKCLDYLPFMLPKQLRLRFQTRLHATLRKYMSVQEGPLTEQAGTTRTWITPRDMEERMSKPTETEHRKELWRQIQPLLDRPAADAFHPYLLRQLSRRQVMRSHQSPAYFDIPWQQILLESVFSGSEWIALCADVGYEYLRAVSNAVETFLLRTAEIIFEDDGDCSK